MISSVKQLHQLLRFRNQFWFSLVVSIQVQSQFIIIPVLYNIIMKDKTLSSLILCAFLLGGNINYLLTYRQGIISPSGPGRIGGHYFYAWCPSVQYFPSVRSENKNKLQFYMGWVATKFATLVYCILTNIVHPSVKSFRIIFTN